LNDILLLSESETNYFKSFDFRCHNRFGAILRYPTIYELAGSSSERPPDRFSGSAQAHTPSSGLSPEYTKKTLPNIESVFFVRSAEKMVGNPNPKKAFLSASFGCIMNIASNRISM